MIVTLPWPLQGLNPNVRTNRWQLAKLKKQYREACGWQAKAQGVVQIVTQPLHLTLTFYPPSRRAYDLDNALASMKSGLDGLSDALGVDDKHFSISLLRSDCVGGMVKVLIEKKA